MEAGAGQGVPGNGEGAGYRSQDADREHGMGELSRRVRVALERLLLADGSEAAGRQRELNEDMERQVEALEREMRGSLESVEGGIGALREEHARGDAAVGAAAGPGGGQPRRSKRGGSARRR